MEEEYIKILINSRNELKNACECSLLSMSEKKQWYKEVEALEWALGELGITVITEDPKIYKADYQQDLIGVDGYKKIFKKIEEYCRKDLAFRRRLDRDGRQPDLFNQGRFCVCDEILNILKGIEVEK